MQRRLKRSGIGGHPSALSLFRRPGNLELDFFLTIPALMRQVIVGTHRHVYAFAGDVDLEPLAVLKRICKASELLDKRRKGVVLFDIAIFLHDLTPMTLQRIASALGSRLRW